MAGKVKGITIEFRGDTTSVDKAIRKINSESEGLVKQLKAVNSALKFNPNNAELLAQKQTILKDRIKQTESSLKDFKAIQDQLDAQNVEKTSKEYMEVRRNIVEAESKLKHFNAEVNKLGNTKLTALAGQIDAVAKKFASVGRTMSTTVTAPIVAAYGLASNLASDYEENLNKIDVAFGDSADSVKAWAETAREQFGLSQVQATGAASSFGALGKGIGLTEGQAADMATTLTGLSADLGSYFNVGTEESAKALEGIFTGESEALKKFGVVMNDTNLAQFAADQGLVWSELDQTEKTMVRYQFVLAKTQDAQGDFARTSDGTANSTKIFKATLQDLGTAIGTQLLPIITPIIQKITEFIAKLADAPEPIQRIITIVGLVAAAVGPVLLGISGGLTLVSKAIMGVNKVMTGLSKGLSLIMAHPIIAGIVAIIAVIILLWNHSEGFRNFVLNTFEVLKNAFYTVRDAFGAVIDWLVAKWESLKAFFAGIPEWFRNLFTTAWENIKAAFANWVSFWSSLWDAVKNKFTSLGTSIASAIGGAVKSGINGVISMIENTINGAIRLINGAIGLINKIPGVSVGTLSNVSLPRLAKGGVLYGAQTVIAGEAGPEAIIPLDKLFRQMDKMAETIAGTGGGGVTVNVYATPGMDVNALAREIERRIIETQNRRRLAWQ